MYHLNQHFNHWQNKGPWESKAHADDRARNTSTRQTAQVEGITNVKNNGRVASMDIGDGESIEINKDNSQVTHIDKSGKRATIWGDPHFKSADGSQFDFHKDAVITLPNGTKLHLDTVKADGKQPTAGDNSPTFAGKVTVTKANGDAVSVGNITGPGELDVDTAGRHQSQEEFLHQQMPDYDPRGIISLNNGQFKLEKENVKFLRPGQESSEYDSSKLFGGHDGLLAPNRFGGNANQNPWQSSAFQNQLRQHAGRCCDQMAESGFFPRSLAEQYQGPGFNPFSNGGKEKYMEFMLQQMMQQLMVAQQTGLQLQLALMTQNAQGARGQFGFGF